MENSNVVRVIILLIFSIVIIFKVIVVKTPNIKNKRNSVELVSDTSDNVIEVPEHFDYVYKRFIIFNPDLDSSTVALFNNVCYEYRLDTTLELLELCVGQLLLESGAKQYYQTGHHKEGRLVRSSAGAIGFAQIMPNTAYGYLTKYVTVNEGEIMDSLGCDSFDFINDPSLTEGEIRYKTVQWLEVEKNNIILWGYILRHKLDKMGNIIHVLVSYNTGTTGMYKFINNGGDLNTHKYMRGIRSKLKFAEQNL